ncbi:MAG: ABC transporter substrate-binding protein [Treponema sp.]|jgi:peptide/nickel transport system substrate-binding protein|nr:ABC transporter substrate-binding protein [Treponema sp.]
MKLTRFLGSAVLMMVLAAGVVFAAAETDQGAAAGGGGATLPRNETFYLNGILWGAVTQFNPYIIGGVSFGLTPNESAARQVIYETLFLYNLLDGKLYPHLADTYTWNGQNLTVTLDRNVKFSDGTPMTSADVVNSYTLHKNYQTAYSGYWSYIDSVTATDAYTVVIRGNPRNFNRLHIETTLAALYITPKHEWDRIVREVGTDPMAISRYANLNPIATGPYKPLLWDESKCVLQRVDTYWGKDSPKFGKLPPPKYIVHNVFKDNASGDAAFRAGEVDMSQQYISQVWRMWETGARVETYIPQAPYYFPGTIPFLVFNTKKPGLNDPAVRRAIAMAVDYDTVGQNAMSGYTAKLVPSLMLPVPAEQSLVDVNALKPYQWSGNLAEARQAANKLLDDAGWVKGSDGIRAKGGVKLSFQAECPTGWSDWNATLEVVAQAGKEIGIDIKTYFPMQTIWQSDKDNGTFDMVMHSYGGPGPASPWNRAYQAIGSSELPAEGIPNTIQNWGRWENAEANDILAKIAAETNPATLKQLWTRLNILYLQNMPCAGLMYRPLRFHTVNTSRWTGFPKINDGSNIPPTLCIDGYGIKGLYNLKAR